VNVELLVFFLIHHHRYQRKGLKEEVLILEQVKLDKGCETWE